jgi:hypothetical protein
VPDLPEYAKAKISRQNHGIAAFATRCDDEENLSRRIMVVGIRIGFGLSGAAMAAVLLLSPVVSVAQTPAPAAGNPAINDTPSPGSAAAPGIASPSNETNIPKGSNPEGGSGNLSAGSGATPSSTASDNPMPSQTGNNPQSSVNDGQPSQTATNPNAASSGSGSSSCGRGPDSMPQGRYASPPNDDAE